MADYQINQVPLRLSEMVNAICIQKSDNFISSTGRIINFPNEFDIKGNMHSKI